MYTQPIAQLDQLVNRHTMRGTLGLLASLATEKAGQCLISGRKWTEDGYRQLATDDKHDGQVWVELGRDLIALARKFSELQ